MSKSIQIKLLLALLTLSMPVMGQMPDSAAVPFVLPLEVYGGSGTILLAWSLPDSSAVFTTRIYRSSAPDSGFDLLADIAGQPDRYLDQTIIPEQHYFYRVEVDLLDGVTLYSSLDTPPFTSAGEVLTTHAGTDSLPAGDPSALAEFLLGRLLPQQLTRWFPSVDSAGIAQVTDFLTTPETDYRLWFDKFTLANFSAFTPLNALAFAEQFSTAFSAKIDTLAFGLSNRLLLTPDEWNATASGVMIAISERLRSLSDHYRSAESQIAGFDPLRIIGAWTDSTGNYRVEYLVLQPQLLAGQNPALTIGGQRFALALPEQLSIGYRDTLALPVSGEWCALELDGQVVQRFPLVADRIAFTCSLDGEYVLTEQPFWDEALFYRTRSRLYINELNYRVSEGRLAVEIHGAADTTSSYGLLLNDSLIAAISGKNGSTPYRIYRLPTDGLESAGWLSLAELQSDSTWVVLESRSFDPRQNLYAARIPDGGNWVVTSFATLGKANDLTRTRGAEITIPEVFALYQNYPNPFNATTTIAFDLLRPALVSLFITDATGRKIDIFMENLQTEPGHFQFAWDGRRYSSGVYFFTLQAQLNDFLPMTFSRKMIFLK
ncbi:MAG: hypothetical protein ABIA75_03870 [Candidatus Neomarinimicrobiota bacterium]